MTIQLLLPHPHVDVAEAVQIRYARCLGAQSSMRVHLVILQSTMRSLGLWGDLYFQEGLRLPLRCCEGYPSYFLFVPRFIILLIIRIHNLSFCSFSSLPLPLARISFIILHLLRVPIHHWGRVQGLQSIRLQIYPRVILHQAPLLLILLILLL